MNVHPQHQPYWDWRAAAQFICGGTGAGLLFFTALAALQDPSWYLRSGLLAVALVGLGLFFVWIKLGRRWRAMLVFLNPRTSWMSREAFLSVPVTGLGLLAVVFSSLSLALVAAVFALGYLYAQARILKEAKGIPAWRVPLIIPLIVTTGLTEGAGLMAVIGIVTGATSPANGVGMWLPVALLLLLVIRFWVWSAYRNKLAVPGAVPLAAADALTDANRPVTQAGHIAPMILAALAIVLPGLAAIFALLAGLTALAGGWYLKFVVFTRVAYNQGFAIKHTPARTPGYGGPGAKPGWGG